MLLTLTVASYRNELILSMKWRQQNVRLQKTTENETKKSNWSEKSSTRKKETENRKSNSTEKSNMKSSWRHSRTQVQGDSSMPSGEAERLTLQMTDLMRPYKVGEDIGLFLVTFERTCGRSSLPRDMATALVYASARHGDWFEFY